MVNLYWKVLHTFDCDRIQLSPRHDADLELDSAAAHELDADDDVDDDADCDSEREKCSSICDVTLPSKYDIITQFALRNCVSFGCGGSCCCCCSCESLS